MERGTILVVEDDSEIVELVSHHLLQLGYAVDSVGDGAEGLKRALSKEYSLVVLDVMLPGLGGLEICRGIREAKKTIPILMLSGKSEDLDKILGLELGADDYVTKPFNVIEFRARVGALLRRTRMQQDARPLGADGGAAQRLSFRGLVMDLAVHRVTLNDQVLDLTPSEFTILRLLLQHQGYVVHRKRLLEEACATDLEVYDDNITTHLSRLRAKLGISPEYADRIATVRGVGYRFEVEDDLIR